MSNLLLAIAVISVPVLGIVVLALSGRRLTRSCGVEPDGSCRRCGRSAEEAKAGGAPQRSCP